MKEDYTKRKNFRNCNIFTASRSLSSITEACDFTSFKEEPLQVLDAFAGIGIVADAIAEELNRRKKDYSITVADINEDYIRRIPDEYTKLCLDLLKGPVRRTYDLIVMRYGLHDLAYRDKIRVLQNLIPSLEKSGRIVICDIMPDKKSRAWLEYHHQLKEDLTMGRNRGVCLSLSQDYIRILEDLRVQAKVTDCFYQESFIREWLKSYGTKDKTVSMLEDLTLQAPEEIKEKLMVFNHPNKGARIYFPIVTIAGTRKFDKQ